MTSATKSTRVPLLFALLAGYLVVKCAWRLLLPGGPYPMPPWHLVTMGMDALLVVLLILLKPSVPAATPGAPVYVKHSGLLFWAGFISGLILIGLRFTSTHSWWTGHLTSGN